MGEISMAQSEFISSDKSLAQPPTKPPLDSSLVEINRGKVPPFGGENREKLSELCFMDIKTASLDRGARRENIILFLPVLPFDDKAVAPKLALPQVGPQDKYFVQTSLRRGSRTRRWRRVRRQSRDNPLQLDVNFLVLATRHSLGLIGSRISGDCSRKRVWVKDCNLGRTRHKAHQRAIRDKRHTSFVESYFIASHDGDAFRIYRHRKMSMSYDGDRSEDRQSEEVQSAYKRFSEVDEEMVIRRNFRLDHTEEQNDENEWSWVLQDKDGDPLAESVSSLHTTQEVLETEIQKLSELSKEFEAEESSCDNKDQDVIVLPHREVDVLEMNERMEHLEQKLKEASNTIRAKDLRLSNLQIVIDSAHRPMLEEEVANIDQLEMEVERQLQEKIQAEIQCLVLVKARQNWQVRAEDQIALKEHKSSAGDKHMKMMLKLQDTESKIAMLKKQVDKLEVHEKELYGTTEVLKMQSRTFKVSLFGLVQLIMLGLSLRMFLARVSVPFGEDVVPT